MDYFPKRSVPCSKGAWNFVLEDDLRIDNSADQILILLGAEVLKVRRNRPGLRRIFSVCQGCGGGAAKKQ